MWIIIELAVGIAFGFTALLGILFRKMEDFEFRSKIQAVWLLFFAIAFPVVATLVHFDESPYIGIITFAIVCGRIWG